MVKTVELNGKVIRYTTFADLAKKLGKTESEARRVAAARRLVTEKVPERILVDHRTNNPKVYKFNINDNFRGMLLRDFGIRTKFANKKIIGERHRVRGKVVDDPVDISLQQGNFSIVDRIPANTDVYVSITYTMFFIDKSGIDCDIYDAIQAALRPDATGYVKPKYARHALRNFNGVRVRKPTKSLTITPAAIPERVFRDPSGVGIWCGSNDPNNLVDHGIDPYGWAWEGLVGEYSETVRDALVLLGYNFTISTFNNKTLELKDMTLRDAVPLRLAEWVNIEYNATDGPDSCVVNYITKKFPYMAKQIKSLESNGGVTVKKFIALMTEMNIRFGIYDEHGKIVHEHDPECPDGNICAVIYNNHIYPTNGGLPRRSPKKELEEVHVDDGLKKLKKILAKGTLPKNIIVRAPQAIVVNNNKALDETNITIDSFEDTEKRFMCNEEYDLCVQYMEQIGAGNVVPVTASLVDLPVYIEKAMNMKDCRSFIPDIDQFKTKPFLWKTPHAIKKSRVVTVDKNKCYPYALSNLPFLIVFDYRKHAIVKNPKTITPHYMYIARPKKYSILMPCTKLYAGYFLEECTSFGVEFDLLEELQCETVNNHYRAIINALINTMNVPMDEFKTIMNTTIGKFERSYSEKDVVKYTGIYTEEAAAAKDGFHCDLGDYKLVFNTKRIYANVRSKLPIATQVKDESRMLLYKKMRELNLSDDQIVQINTDSISYYGTLPNDLNPDDFNCWKSSSFGELGQIDDVHYDDDITLLNLPCVNPNPRILHMKYAGAGKTTHIIKELVPRLIAEGKSYIVLTPTHKTLTEYQRDNIRCEVIQKYIFSGTIPDEEYVIVDEVGFITLECHDVLYKIVQAGKSLECFGDFKQLPPVDEPYTYDQPHYLNYMFTEIDTDYTNYRNTFTTEYYDSLINSDKKGFLIKEIKKHSTVLKHAPRVICYRHDTRRMYNKKIMNMLGLPTWDVRKGHTDWDPTDIDIMCVKDGLRHKGICNRSEYTVIYCDAKKVTIVPSSENKMDLSNPIKITFKQLHTYFEPSYAINVHQAQGLTLDSYHWAAEDDKFVTNRIAYVVISRLRHVAE